MASDAAKSADQLRVSINPTACSVIISFLQDPRSFAGFVQTEWFQLYSRTLASYRKTAVWTTASGCGPYGDFIQYLGGRRTRAFCRSPAGQTSGGRVLLVDDEPL